MGWMVRAQPHVCYELPLTHSTHSTRSTPVAILDDQNRIVAVLLGRPAGKTGQVDDWPEVVAGLEAAINELGDAATFDSEHRRGPLPAKDFGVSHGGGQTVRVPLSCYVPLCVLIPPALSTPPF